MWPLIKNILFLLEPEDAHEISKFGIRLLARLLPLRPLLDHNPVGLAAGFDKNAEVLTALPHFGFGHVEIGTVTPLPQGGNPRPRLFRDPKGRALFNRMGFNNLGATLIAERVQKAKKVLPPGFEVGINLGKNKNTPDEQAAEDYAKAARPFLDTADYFAINVSSPNTPGLRALQTPEALTSIARAVREVIASGQRSIPLYVKLAPELEGGELKILLPQLEAAGVTGLILTNTLGGDYIYRGTRLSGGWSGQILSSRSLDRLREARSLTSLPIISVGGIMSPKDAQARLDAGANRVQLYSGWVFGGPYFARRIVRALGLRSKSG